MVDQNELDLATTLTMDYIDRKLYDMMCDVGIKEEYADLVIEDLIEEIEDMEDIEK